MEDFARKLPKVELHAHLNGSISDATILRLAELKTSQGRAVDKAEIDRITRAETAMDFAEIFERFGLLHKLVDTPEAVHLATVDVIHDFSRDHVRYLELRSTPKHVERTGMTRRQYVQSMVNATKEAVSSTGITVRLLLSIDRRNDTEVARETVELARQFRRDGVVGIDLSGHPKVGDARNFIPALEEARRHGLKLTLHLAEDGEFENLEEETNGLLRVLVPDRIGHGVFLPRCPEADRIVKQHRVPIEVCLSSNTIGQVWPDVTSHPAVGWYSGGHPISICTDDTCIFKTTSSAEYRLAADILQLTPTKLWKLSYNSLHYCFIDEVTKSKLMAEFEDFKELNNL